MTNTYYKDGVLIGDGRSCVAFCKDGKMTSSLMVDGDLCYFEEGDKLILKVFHDGEFVDVTSINENFSISFEAKIDEIEIEKLREFFEPETESRFDELRRAVKGDTMGYVPPKAPMMKGGERMSRMRINPYEHGVSMSVMEHTNMRFDTMTIRQMWTRMGKTTKPDKLKAFCIVAYDRGHMDLAIAAAARLMQINGDNSMMLLFSAKPSPKKDKRKSKSERLLRKLDI